ncbi:hypothetical protein K435DRAFT_871739 [Dendrothele bispora CBS 962.96]|uniref:Uncharacterized protein n=1 Tax=Dendrothele bispora (strain CBS 962.96) TaxID=1314807 RepID=A0A4S8L3E3_DENBC|nr:hypothetical protein K435DRAFT_871739 [Dendrothele bispora CBS 962.96]
MTTTLTAPFMFSPTGLPRFPPSAFQRIMTRVSQQHQSLHRQLYFLLQFGLKATGVQYPLSSTSPKQTVNANNKMQDSCTGSFAYSTFSVTTAGLIHGSQSSQSQYPELMSFINSATAYLPLSFLFTSQSNVQSLISSARSSMQSQIQAYKISGYKGTGPGD